MEFKQWIVTLIFIGMTACATVSERARLDRFDETAEAYRWAILDSDFRAAAKFIDGNKQMAASDLEAYKEIKVVAYKITHTDVSDDRHRIVQDAEIEYFLLNRNILRSMQHRQVWIYRQTAETWQLTTKLPVFNR